MPAATHDFPAQAAGKIRQKTKDQITEAQRRFGATPGAIVRMALEDFMPRYLSAAGRTEHLDFLAALAADLAAAPDLQADLEKFRTLWLRDPRSARAALAAARRAA
jgi:hypothetical protein